jgi:hypothetical protein
MPFAHAIGFEPLPLNLLLMIIGLVFIYLLCAELVKRYVLRRVIPDAWS